MRTTIPSSDGRGGATQRVLVIGNSSLLGEGIESILRNERGLSIQSINVDDEESLFRRIRELDPDVIVLVEQTASIDTGYVLRLIDQFPKVQILGVTLQSPDVQAYDKTQVTITHPYDFLNIIRGNPDANDLDTA